MNMDYVQLVCLVLLSAASLVVAAPAAQSFNFPENDGNLSDEQNRWLNAVRPYVTAPEHIEEVRSATSASNKVLFGFPAKLSDYRPPFFDTFPHGSAVMEWQRRRIGQGLPTFQLSSSRPGFPFHS